MADWVRAVETIGRAGYVVSIGADRAGLPVVTAIDERTFEAFIVRGPDLYATIRELAGQIGIPLGNFPGGRCSTF